MINLLYCMYNNFSFFLEKSSIPDFRFPLEIRREELLIMAFQL
jgi:hypothetical protein